MAKTGSLILILISILANADVNVSATVNSNQVGVGDRFQLTVGIDSSESLNVEEPKLPNIQGFVLNGPPHEQVGTQSTFINGQFKVEQSRQYSYVLEAQKEGQFVIEPIEVIVNGKAFKTKSIKITVSKSQLKKPQNFAQGEEDDGTSADPFEDTEDELFNQLLKRHGVKGGFQQQQINPNDAFFIQVDVDKNEAYEGEQITTTWNLYTQHVIRDIDTLKYPTLNGFWKEDISIATTLNYVQEVINGISYRKAPLVSYALFPIKKGELTIDSYKAKCTVISSNGFLGFGLGQPQVFSKVSQPIKIKVKPIPIENRPSSYTGAVGSFQISSEVKDKNIKTNQPFALSFNITGVGNAKNIELPSLNLPNGLEVYDTQKNSKFEKDGSSFKNFEILLIPRQPGPLEIPPIELAMFDTKKEKFVILKTQSLHLEVSGTGSPEAPVLASKKDELSKPIDNGLITQWKEPLFSQITWIYIGGIGFISLTIAFVSFGFIFLTRGQKIFTLQQLVSKRFIEIEELLKNNNYRDAGAQTTNAMYEVLGELSNLGGASQELDKMIELLPPSRRIIVAGKINELMRFFQMLSFAPESHIQELKEKNMLSNKVKEVKELLNLVLK